jgi:hypothetical protein
MLESGQIQRSKKREGIIRVRGILSVGTVGKIRVIVDHIGRYAPAGAGGPKLFVVAAESSKDRDRISVQECDAVFQERCCPSLLQ